MLWCVCSPTCMPLYMYTVSLSLPWSVCSPTCRFLWCITRSQTSGIMCHDVFTYVTTQSHVTWLIYVGHDSCAGELVLKGREQGRKQVISCAMTYLHTTRLNYIWLHSLFGHTSMQDTTHLYGTWLIKGGGNATRPLPTVHNKYLTLLMCVCDTTHLYMWRDYVA